ncbi:uncharacterized protein EI97DRAFT_373113 [Westerdykella ornata]|uniref:Six-hairpin glycosidase n=1 Tax=Westerdykella ornata TaxID=318751 RepID=A0A6A6JRE3_WESOR|nr:uncharacterized protein EI97DRAFT_373113 [Westerdykella ornata]KAF2278296.1 hypothetical protein EI97DRAFT_373113 [Westerdykella ornata]
MFSSPSQGIRSTTLPLLPLLILLLLLPATITPNPITSTTKPKIDRESLIRHFNPILHASQPSHSPVQVGNGNFAFGADITGLQTFVPHNTLSSWGWHNSLLPTTTGATNGTSSSSPADFTGTEWWTHGRLVKYDIPSREQAELGEWLRANPHRIHLGRIGLWFGPARNVSSEEELEGKTQVVELYEGIIKSSFEMDGVQVQVETVAAPDEDTLGVRIRSSLVGRGELGVFFEYPYADGRSKFEAPFVGVWEAEAVGRHRTRLEELRRGKGRKKKGARIRHDLDATTYFTEISWEEGEVGIRRVSNLSHRYILSAPAREPSSSSPNTLTFTATFTPKDLNNISTPTTPTSSFKTIKHRVRKWWSNYWTTGAFLSLPISTSPAAYELQRRILLSQYLLAINCAAHDYPPQESGLVNNGWYGKFHLEMVFWHLAHWTVWDKWSLARRSLPGVYTRFLPSSFARAAKQGYEGARLGKMSDPTGRSAPGEINSLLIWQQGHPLWFAEMEYRRYPTGVTLRKWDAVITGVADFMADYAFWNSSTRVYDLGPPMYPVSENTDPNATVNAAFELAYWRFGLGVAVRWRERLGRRVPWKWRLVRENLARLPVEKDGEDGNDEEVYVLYEGVRDMWTTPSLTEDHPALLAINGVLRPDSESGYFNASVFANTVEKVYATWNFTHSYGWDFPLLAMTAARMGERKKAVEWLLHDEFRFDEVGMPVGGTRVPTPYFPASSGLLLAVGMMAGGWDGDEEEEESERMKTPGFPEDWDVVAEGFQRYI